MELIFGRTNSKPGACAWMVIELIISDLHWDHPVQSRVRTTSPTVTPSRPALQHTWWGLGPAVQLQNLSKGIVLPSPWKVRATYSTPIPLGLGVCQLSCWGSLQGAGKALWCLGHPGQLSQDPWEYSSRGHHQRSWHSPIDPVMTLNSSMGPHIIMAFARSSGH